MATTTPNEQPKTKATTAEDRAREEARKALEKRRARREAGLPSVKVTPEQRAIAGTLRERDHRDGCPVYGSPEGAARVEAYAETIIAPGPEARAVNARAGESLIMVRCLECGMVRYHRSAEDQPVKALDDFTDRALERMAGVDAEEPDEALDGSL